MRFGQKIVELRSKLGMSQKELSEKSGLSAMTICNYETGKIIPNPISIAKLSRALNCDYDELYDLVQKEKYGNN